MSASIVRSKYLITKSIDRHKIEKIENGAVLVENGIVKKIANIDALVKENPGTPILGNGRQVLLPGFVNGHHHIGLTPV